MRGVFEGCDSGGQTCLDYAERRKSMKEIVCKKKYAFVVNYFVLLWKIWVLLP